MKRTLTFLLLASLFTAATGALAQGITDPIGDLLPTYIGPQNGDVDVASAFAGYDPASDTWRPMANSPLPEPENAIGASDYASAWTGSELLVWGGPGPKAAI